MRGESDVLRIGPADLCAAVPGPAVTGVLAATLDGGTSAQTNVWHFSVPAVAEVPDGIRLSVEANRRHIDAGHDSAGRTYRIADPFLAAAAPP